MGSRSKRRVYVANVRCRDSEQPASAAPMVYAVLASTPGDAVRAIRKEYGYECTVEFDNGHSIKEAEIIDRLGLEDGRARSMEGPLKSLP
jgi:hypothetical protein